MIPKGRPVEETSKFDSFHGSLISKRAQIQIDSVNDHINSLQKDRVDDSFAKKIILL
jgi:hypothetical protein